MKAALVYHDKLIDVDGSIIEMKIWRVPLPVDGSHHLLKYSLYYGRGGGRIVGYDNESGKGDHRHLHDVEMPYTFTTVEQLLVDFISDVQRERGQQR